MSLFPASYTLRRCVRTSPYLSVRKVSRTSAINRGLRASRPSDRGGGRQAPPVDRAIRIKKHTSHDDELFGADAPEQRLRSRPGRNDRDGGGDRGREGRTPGFTRAQRSDRGFGGKGDGVKPARGGTGRVSTFGRDMRRDLEERSSGQSSFSDRSDDRRKPSGGSSFGRERRKDDYEAPPRRSDSLGEADDFRKPPRLPTSRSSGYREARDRGAPRRGSYDAPEEREKSFRPRGQDQTERRPERYSRRGEDRADERGDNARQASRYSDNETRSSDRPPNREWKERKPQDDRPPRSSNRIRDDDDDVPVSIPYSTASSQFIYGTNSVLAALKAQRRKCHHLHVRDSRTIGRDDASSDKTEALVRLARQSGIKVSHSATLRLLDKMSDNRPHNGVVLEASALPAPPLVSLGTPVDKSVPLTLDHQSAEDTATNGSADSLPAPKHRSPLILFLDGITDPGNVGAILRTAHFFNVDAVAIATNTCANLASPVLAKASAGACEAVPIFAVKKPAEFVYKSRKDGWKIYAAVAPDAKARKAGRQKTSIEVSGASPLFASPRSEPVILMLGAEGEGLRENLRSKADVEVTIERGGKGGVDVGVDSVNVSVAAGVLVDAFMRRPAPVTARLRDAVVGPTQTGVGDVEDLKNCEDVVAAKNETAVKETAETKRADAEESVAGNAETNAEATTKDTEGESKGLGF